MADRNRWLEFSDEEVGILFDAISLFPKDEFRTDGAKALSQELLNEMGTRQDQDYQKWQEGL